MADASLVASISTKGAKKAADELKKVSVTANKAEGSTEKLSKSSSNTSKKLDELSRSTKKSSDSLKLYASSAKSGAVAVAAIAGAVGAYTLSIANQNRELQLQARLVGVTVRDYEAMAFAASQFGVTAEQLSDQFKDVNEKIGEFSATGGGGFQDFLDVMGKTKDEGRELAKSMEGLTGKDALLKIVSEMEAAGKSTRQMSFAVEGLGNDLTKTLPLFLNSGKALKDLGSEFKDLTSPLTQGEVDLYAELAKNAKLSKSAFRSLAENALIPVAKYFNKAAESASFFFASLNAGTEADLLTSMLSVSEEIKEQEEALENNTTAWGRFKNVLAFDATTTSLAERNIRNLKLELSSLQGQLETNRALNKLDKPGVIPPLAPIKTGTAEGEKVRAEERKAELEDLEFANTVLGLKLEAENAADAQLQVATNAKLERERVAAAESADIYLQGLELKAAADDAALAAQKKSDNEQKDAADKLAKDRVSAASGAADNLAIILGKENELYKARMIQKTIMDTYSSATASYTALASIPVVGPALGFAAAGLAVTAGLANVAQISAAREQGGQISAGQNVLVGERGPEVIQAPSAGRVRTANQIRNDTSGGGDTVLNVVVIDQGVNNEVTAEQNDEGKTIILIRNVVSGDFGNNNSDISKGFANSKFNRNG